MKRASSWKAECSFFSPRARRPNLRRCPSCTAFRSPPAATPPGIGARLGIAGFTTEITAIGEYAWRKIGEIGHVVINFGGDGQAPRPGEISVKPVDLAALSAALTPGADITVDD